MGANTKIEWAHHTFNPWIGCEKVSEGCRNCYAQTWDARWHKGIHWGPGAPRKRTSAAKWREPIRWNLRVCATPGAPRERVFCASLADWLDPAVPPEMLADLLRLIARTPCLDWLLLTKRPANWRAAITRACEHYADAAGWLDRFCMEASGVRSSRYPFPPNVWVGTTVENQAAADERIAELYEIPARRHFLSCEPLLEPLDLSYWLTEPIFPVVDWVICGGESGPHARPMHADWARQLRDQCHDAGNGARVAFFMKQMGGAKSAKIPKDLMIREVPQ